MEPHDLAIPILPSRSVSATIAFYKRLGFEGGAHEFDSGYAILRRGTVELHFFTHRELVPEASFAGCYIRVLDVESISAPSHPASYRVKASLAWIVWKPSHGAFESSPSSTLTAIFFASDKSSRRNRVPTCSPTPNPNGSYRKISATASSPYAQVETMRT
jgi:hypothetical protein